MASQKQLLTDISEFLQVPRPFTPNNAHFEPSELEGILQQLKNYERPEHLVPTGERPVKKKIASEGKTHYREMLCTYIKDNTDIEIPVSSIVSVSFYNAIMDYLGLWENSD